MSEQLHAPGAGQVVDEPGGDPDLPVGVAGLALLVDGQGDHGRAVLLDDRHHPGVAGAGAVAVLVVDRVDDAAAAEHLQARLDDLRLGGVQHDRQGGRGGEAAGELAHVLGAVAADVVDAEVEQVRAVAGLAAGDLDAGLPVAGQHRLAERLRAVGVGALADHQHAGVLPERHLVVDRRRRGSVRARTRGRGLEAADPARPRPRCAPAWCRSSRRPGRRRTRGRSGPAPRPARPGVSG